uniref:Uncharacterized protein n=1 Tax=Myotis myotis TaxID=51298 RepID=A0A7J7WHI6_MYOMY|nr:hypothetical protein mMyoMyo1_012058 [Myotis myotis]
MENAGRNRFGSVDRASACGLKGPRFDSGQGHVPGLRAHPPVGDVQEAADRCSSLIDVSNFLSLSLPLCEKSIKYIRKKKKKIQAKHGPKGGNSRSFTAEYSLFLSLISFSTCLNRQNGKSASWSPTRK